MIDVGKTVKVHYKGTLDDGTIFDSSEGREPLKFQIGSGQVISRFDAAVQQMEIGSSKKIIILCADAYGDVQPEMIVTVPHSRFPEDLDPEVGQMLELQSPQGNLPVLVVEINDEGITLDGNHPLAGEDLTFEIFLVEVF